MIKQAEKLYDEEKYQEAIDLLSKPYYEEYTNQSIALDKDIKDGKSLLIECYARIGLNAIDEKDKEKVGVCCDYITNHVDDCEEVLSYLYASLFLQAAIINKYSDVTRIDIVLQLLQTGREIDTFTGEERADYDLYLNTSYIIKGLHCIEEGNFDIAEEYVDKIIASKIKVQDDCSFSNLDIGLFLTQYYLNRDFMNLNENTFQIASGYLHEALKSDKKNIRNGANWGLGLLNLENYQVASSYLSEIEGDEECEEFISFYNAIFNLRDSPKEAIRILLSLRKSEVVPNVMTTLSLVKIYFANNQEIKGVEMLNSLSRGDFNGALISHLPTYDLFCCIYLKKEEALEHLQGWTQKYPESELIKEYLEIATKSSIENDDFIDFKLINIPINWNYFISRSDLIDEITTESLQIPKSLLRSKLKSKPFQLSGGFKIDNKTNIYSSISLVQRENFRIALIGPKHKNRIQLKRIRDDKVVSDYLSDEFYSFLHILNIEKDTKKSDYRIYISDESSELIKEYFRSEKYGNRRFSWIENKAQKATVVSRINKLFPKLILTEFDDNSDQYYLLDHGISTDH